jgi:nucleotide-binding universal stress UspA family protein
MESRKILVPVDLTQSSDKVAAYAAAIARKANLGISLLHIQRSSSDTAASDQLKLMVAKLESVLSVKCDYSVVEGNLFNEITNASYNQEYSLMVIGAYGLKGIREKLLGSDILKLVKNIPIPVLTLQESGYSFPSEGIRTILFPASSHENFRKNIDATVFFAKLYGAKVIVYTIDKPGFSWSDKFKSNIEQAIRAFEMNDIKCQRVNEPPTTYSAGFAKQILQYAGEINADLISVVSVATAEHYYIADSDKERLLTNELHIPVLCVSDKEQVQ